MALTDEAMQVYLQKECDSDLAFLLADGGLSLPVQYRVVHAGYKSLRRFVGLEDTRPLFRQVAVTTFNLDPTASAADRLQLSILLSIYDVAKEQLAREVGLRAEAKALRQPRPVSNQERIAMRRVVEITCGKLSDSEVPAATYLSDKIEELEDNAPQASPLDEILSLEDDEQQLLGAGIDLAGRITVTRKKTKVKMPPGPEELRQRIRVEGHLWIFLSTKFTNRSWLANMSMTPWQKHVDYILGKKCYLLELVHGGLTDAMQIKPSWHILLEYEFQVRKKAFALVRDDGTPLSEALGKAASDTELRDLHFMAPLLLSSRNGKGGKKNHWQEEDAGGKGGKEGGKKRHKGGGKEGKGKGSKTKGKSDLLSKTPDGRLICFGYNSTEGCKKPGCSMLHVCRKKGCLQTHPLHEHPTTPV
jgi:hypothetical protein